MPELVSVERALERHRELVIEAVAQPELQGLIWEATLACNLTCVHCGNPVEGKTGEKGYDRALELRTDEVKRIFSQIASDYDARRIPVGITGGEPTLRRDLPEIISHIKQTGFGSVSLTTNCLLTGRDPGLIDRLVAAGVSLFTISLDGLKEGHDRQRMLAGSFDEVVRTIRYIRERHPSVGVTVNTVATPLNWHDVPGVYKLVSELKIPTWNLGPVSPVGRAVDPRTLLTNEQLRDLLEWIAEKNMPANVAKTGMRISWLCDGWVGSQFEGRVRDSMFFCGAGTRIASILYDGKAATCLEVNRKIGVQGDLRTERFKDVWEGRYTWFRKDREKFRQGPCATCSQWDWCQGSSLHLRNEDGSLIECIYYRQSQAKPRSDGLPSVIETVELVPLTMVERGEGWVVGNNETGTFAEMPPLAVAILRTLERDGSVESARVAVKEGFGKDVDVGAFVRSIAAGGFVAKINGEPLPAHLVPKKRKTLFDGVEPGSVRWMRSPLLWVAALIPFALSLGIMAADPSYVPTYRDFFWTDWYTLVGISTFLVMLVMVMKHELSHVLMARAHGSRASLSLGTRVMYLAVQTDATDLWLLPTWDRIKVYLAGMASDAFVLGSCVLLEMLGRQGYVPALAEPVTLGLLKLTALLAAMMILFQFFFQVRTDVYYMVAHGLDCRNLYGDARTYIRRKLGRHVKRWARTPEPRITPREFKWVKMYAVLHFVGVGVMLAYFATVVIPTLVVAYGWALGVFAAAASGEPQTTRDLLDAAMFIGLHAAYFGLLFYLQWRNRRATSTGVVEQHSGDELTRRLLAHPAPEGMWRSTGGKIAQLDPARGRAR